MGILSSSTAVHQKARPPVPPDCPPGYGDLMTACWGQEPAGRYLRLHQAFSLDQRQLNKWRRVPDDPAARPRPPSDRTSCFCSSKSCRIPLTRRLMK